MANEAGTTKTTRKRHATTGLDLTSLTTESAPAPVKTVAGREPSANPFIELASQLWDAKGNADKTEGRGVIVPAAAEREVTNALRYAANHWTKRNKPMGVAVATDKAGTKMEDGRKVPTGQIRIRFAFKSRKQSRKSNGATTA